MIKKLLLCIICFVVHIPSYSISEKGPEGKIFLEIKEVVTDEAISRSSSEYEYGKILYPKFSSEGLPEDFLIKKKADLVIDPSDINEIIISKDYQSIEFQKIMKEITGVPEDKNTFSISIILSNSEVEKLCRSSKRFVGKKIAIVINGKIFSILSVLDPICSAINISVIGIKIEDIVNDVEKLSDNITVNEN